MAKTNEIELKKTILHVHQNKVKWALKMFKMSFINKLSLLISTRLRWYATVNSAIENLL